MQFIISAVLIGLTVVIHALVLDRLMHYLEQRGSQFFHTFRLMWRAAILTIAVLGVFCAHIIQIWVWALLYMAVGAITGLEEALYFSTSTFTTVGFGDIVLDDQWRLVSAFQSANGFILFGWSTAFIFEVMSRLYKDDLFNKMPRKS